MLAAHRRKNLLRLIESHHFEASPNAAILRTKGTYSDVASRHLQKFLENVFGDRLVNHRKRNLGGPFVDHGEALHDALGTPWRTVCRDKAPLTAYFRLLDRKSDSGFHHHTRMNMFGVCG